MIVYFCVFAIIATVFSLPFYIQLKNCQKNKKATGLYVAIGVQAILAVLWRIFGDLDWNFHILFADIWICALCIMILGIGCAFVVTRLKSEQTTVQRIKTVKIALIPIGLWVVLPICMIPAVLGDSDLMDLIKFPATYLYAFNFGIPIIAVLFLILHCIQKKKEKETVSL